jgi:plasmid stabilization system protein ParE
MSYKVSLVPHARLQLLDAALWWAERRSTEQAVRWLEGFDAALESLATDPERWPVAAESEVAGFEVHELIYGVGRKKTHRAVFEIREHEVVVHSIRHLAQDSLTLDDFTVE